MNIGEIVQLVISGSTLIGIAIMVYKFSADPDAKNKTSIELMEQKCEFKSGAIQREIGEIKDDLLLLKENHIAHIEKDVAELGKGMVKILTVLEMKDKKQN